MRRDPHVLAEHYGLTAEELDHRKAGQVSFLRGLRTEEFKWPNFSPLRFLCYLLFNK
jgi:hypothetical protein